MNAPKLPLSIDGGKQSGGAPSEEIAAPATGATVPKLTDTEREQLQDATDRELDRQAGETLYPVQDFNWSREDLVCTEQRATAVYRNQKNQVVIRQESPCQRCDEDEFLVFNEECLPALIRHLAAQLPNEGAEEAIRNALDLHNF